MQRTCVISSSIAILLLASSVLSATTPINTNSLQDSLRVGDPFLGAAIDLYMFDSVQYDWLGETHTITPSQLNGGSIIGFRGGTIELRAPEAYSGKSLPPDPQSAGPQRTDIAAFLSTNAGYGQLPAGSDGSLDPGTSSGAAFTFGGLGVRNLAGPDILIIEDSTTTEGVGDTLRVCGLDSAGQSHTPVTLTVTAVTDWGSASPITSVNGRMCTSQRYSDISELSTGTATANPPIGAAHYRAGTLIDLSDLGYADNARCRGIFLQCDAVADHNANRLDPMIIAGLNTCNKVCVDFDNALDLTDDFYSMPTGGGGFSYSSGIGSGGEAGRLQLSASSRNVDVAVYDTVPDSTPGPDNQLKNIMLQADFKFLGGEASKQFFGLAFNIDANRSGGSSVDSLVLQLRNVDHAGEAYDTWRLRRGNLEGASWGADILFEKNFIGFIPQRAEGGDNWLRLIVKLSNSPDNTTLNLSANLIDLLDMSVIDTWDLPNLDYATDLAGAAYMGEVGFLANDEAGGNSVLVDNFCFQLVPEPATMLLLLTGGLGFALFRTRRRR